MTPIPVLVQHHPSRADLLNRITSVLPNAIIVTDPDPDGPPSAWRTYRSCLAAATMLASSHVLIVQDDAIPCPHLADVLPRIADRWAATLVSLFTGHAPGRTARLVTGAPAGTYVPVRTSQWCPTVALLWPTHLCESAARTPTGRQRRADDYVLGAWATGHRVPVVATAPSLVQHVDDQPSLAGQRSGTTWRTAPRWIGDQDPRPLPW